MKKSVFTNETFYYLLLIYLGTLLSYNIYLTLIRGSIWGVLPITIQSTLLYLILTKSKYAKQSIRIWAIVFVIIAPSLILSAQLLEALSGHFEKVKPTLVTYQVLILISGILVLVFTRRTVFVRIPDKNSITTNN